MCGIVAIVRRPSSRSAPKAEELLTLVRELGETLDAHDVGALGQTQVKLDQLNALLAGVPGATSLMTSPGLVEEIEGQLTPLMDQLSSTDADAAVINENLNAARRSAKDALWAIVNDRLAVAGGIRALGGTTASPTAIASLCSVHDALSALDRLEGFISL